MKRHLFLFVLFLPLFSFAQFPKLYKDLATKVNGISVIHFNDKLNILLINIDDKAFEVVGLNDQMAIVWRTTFSGYLIRSAKFKDKVVAISIAGDLHAKDKGPVYEGILIDPQTGQKVIEKTLYEASATNTVFANILITNDTFYGISLRESGLSRDVPESLVYASPKKYADQINDTKKMVVLQFDEKLDVADHFEPVAPKNARNLDVIANATGDIFTYWQEDQSISIYRYERDAKQAPATVKADVVVPKDMMFTGASFLFKPSPTNRTGSYYGLLFLDKNNDDKNTCVIGYVDAPSGAQKKVIEVFDRDHAKAITKAFASPNEKVSDPDLGELSSLHLKYLDEVDGKLIVAIASQATTRASFNGGWIEEKNVIINAYDDLLSLKYTQLMPSNSTARNKLLPIGFQPKDHKLIVLANNKHGLESYDALYGTLDIGTGKWDAIQTLSKKDLSSSEHADGENALWFGDTFVLPYIVRRGTWLFNNFNVDLQQNSYK